MYVPLTQGSRVRAGADMSSNTQTAMSTLYGALDAAPDIMFIHRPDGKLLYANGVARDCLGVSMADVDGLPPWAWTDAPREVIEKRRATIRKCRTHTFVAERTDVLGERYDEVHSRWVETAEGPVIISVTRDVTERVEAEESLRRMAFFDPLTGLANRTLLEDRLKLAITSAARHGDLLGVLYIDINDFKPINDTFGHSAGDRVLQVLAQRMSASMRSEDTVSRVGGDEFVIVLPRLASVRGVERAAEKIRDVIAEPVLLDDGRACDVSATIGHALFDRENDEAHSLLIRADIAMYHARRNGQSVASAVPLG